MPKNKIQDLRDHLFETIEELRDKENPGDIKRAMAVANVAQAIIHSAKIEIDYLRVTGGTSESGFIPDSSLLPAPTITPRKRLTQ